MVLDDDDGEVVMVVLIVGHFGLHKIFSVIYDKVTSQQPLGDSK